MTTVNDRSAVAAAVAISFISMAPFLVLPLFVGAVANDRGLNSPQIAWLASTLMLGAAISSVLAMFWVRKVDCHKAAYLALSVVAVSFFGAIFTDSLLIFFLLVFLGGLGGGSAYSLVLTALSDNRNSERCFGFSLAAQVLFQVIGLFFLPTLTAVAGAKAGLILFSVLAVVGLCLVSALPQAGMAVTQPPVKKILPTSAALWALGGCLLFFFNVGVVWTFIERMAYANGFSAKFIGMALSAGVSLGVLGALAAAWCGDRWGYVRPLTIGAVITLLSLCLLLAGMSPLQFVIALALYNFAWNFSLAFQYAAVNAVDKGGRAVAIAPAFHATGAAIGPSLAALFITANDYIAVNILAAVAVLLSLLFFVLAIGKRKHGCVMAQQES
ncbi:MFS transporter [Dasania marina]|uniref:MFS transporter n=1 Tax=Dasania marina TaxID=471499 RepID=UPI0030D79530|tara:strand:- start:2151 stop:3305 length:1155 start_codon:yes stop_codon:yes gene_type:complete